MAALGVNDRTKFVAHLEEVRMPVVKIGLEW